MSPQISIVIPTYERLQTLKTTLPSYAQEGVKEIIVIDDASSQEVFQGTKKFIEEANLSVDLVLVRLSKNTGAAAAREVGVRRARSPLVFFGEDDVLLEDGCMARLLNTFLQLERPDDHVGLVAPKLTRPDHYSTLGGSGLREYVRFSRLTGDIKANFELDASEHLEIPTTHACYLIPAELYLRAGGYSGIGGYIWRSEPRLHFRLRRMGYRLYYEPRALAHHLIPREGGFRAKIYRFGLLRGSLLLSVNHARFVLRNMGVGGVFMSLLYLIWLLYTELRRRGSPA